MKISYSTLLLSMICTTAFAQESVTVSVGGGRSFSSNTLMGDGVQAGADVFVPLFRKGWDGSVKGSGKFALGILAGGYYQSAKNSSPDLSGLQSKYKLPTGDLEITNTSNSSRAFAFSAGLQADLTFGSVTLSPSISGGYFTLTRDGSAQNTQVLENGTTRNVILSASPAVKNQGLIIIPQLKIGYQLARNLSVYAAGSVNAGPNISSTQYDLIPAGGFNDKNIYEAMQLTAGKLALDGNSKEAAYITTSIRAGLSWSFGKRNSARRVGTTKSSGSGAASASYAAGRAVMSADSSRHPRQTPGTTFGAKVAQGLQTGNPIGGIIVKGGKNPGGGQMTVTTDNNGQFELTIREAGNYRFVLTAPVENAAQGRSISEKGVKKSDNPIYTGNGDSGVNPMHNPGAFVASPGNPIGGIIVKGGKNPGGNTITITTNNNGEINLNGLTAGKYKFIVSAP